MDIRHILIIGDSHTDAIKRALRKQALTEANGVEVKAYRYVRLKDGKEIGDLSNQQIENAVSDLASDDLLVSTIGGNQHQVVSLMQHPIPFDFYTPITSICSDIESSQIIPYTQLLDYFMSGLRGGDGKRLCQLKDKAKCKVVHLVPPPPKVSKSHILNYHETHFAKSGLTERGVSSACLRLKMWKLQVTALESVCGELGVDLIYPPETCIDHHGYLAEEFYALDATHGNVNYGRTVLKQLMELVTA